WPPQSPDLNLIEALWADMETELGEAVGRVNDIEVLKIMLRNAWNSIPVDKLDSLIRSMPRRLAAVIAVGGHATPY
ncbi:transposable element Tc1 transposase, partial [Morchella snyderi]